MNLPQLTAEASLYRCGTHYRTSPGTSLARSCCTIWTAQGDTGTGDTGTRGSEIIYVTGTAPIQCPPGYEQQGNTCVLLDAGGTPPIPVPGRGPVPGKNKGNGRNGGNYNPVRGGQCCAGDSFDHGIYQFNPAADVNDWECCQYYGPDYPLNECVSCNTKNGSSQSCADGWCQPTS
jgi:hypothetical protein